MGIGQYVTSSTCHFEGRINHVKENTSLTDQAKSAVLEFLTESDEFHKLVCDITGTERKQVKASQELEKLKDDYLRVCEEKKKLLSNYNYILKQNKIKVEEYKELLKQYEDALLTNTRLKTEKEKAEKEKYKIEKMYNIDVEHLNKCNQSQAKTITDQMNDIIDLMNKLAEQMSLVKKYVAKSEKLQSKLDKASKRYGELIKTISDRDIKSI